MAKITTLNRNSTSKETAKKAMISELPAVDSVVAVEVEVTATDEVVAMVEVAAIVEVVVMAGAVGGDDLTKGRRTIAGAVMRLQPTPDPTARLRL